MRPLDIEAPTAGPGKFAQPPPRQEWSTGTRRAAFLTMLLPLAIGFWAQPVVLGPLVLGLIFWGLPEQTTERTYLAAWAMVIVAVSVGAAWGPAGQWERRLLEMEMGTCHLTNDPQVMARQRARDEQTRAILAANPDRLPPAPGTVASFAAGVLVLLSPAFYAPAVVVRRRRRRRADERAKTQATTF